jgi:hypothetical protein
MGEIIFKRLHAGSHKVVIEVFRGPNYYDYSNIPITLKWNSLCDYYVVFSSLELRPTFLQPCARIEFHNTMKTFSIDARYAIISAVILIRHCSFARFQ